jgi:hypothetical protein
MEKPTIPNSKELIRIDVKWESGEDVCLRVSEASYFITKNILRGLETGELISWHYHDVYKPITYVIWNGKQIGEGHRFYLPELELYDMDKLRQLADGHRFKERRYSFFFYGVVERLLGMSITEQGMSGLFR